MGQNEKLIDIACQVRAERDLSIAIADGSTFTDIIGQQTEKWFWLPRSLIEINEDGSVTMPEWLAREKGLI